MYCSTTVNKPFTERLAEARPVSHLAAFVLLATSISMVHHGVKIALTDAADLVTATTLAIAAIEWFQWTALGRMAKAAEADDDNRVAVIKLQSIGIGIFQVILYTIAVVGYAAKGGLDWSGGWPLFGAIGIAALFACLSFSVKWTSCEKIADKKGHRAGHGPNGGTRAPIDEAIFGAPRLAAPARAGNVSNLKERVARHNEDRANRQALLDAGRNTFRDEHGRFAPRMVAG